MAGADVPEALSESLGRDGAYWLVQWLASSREEWKDEVSTTAIERFESRLTTEISSLRVDFARELSTFRQEVTRDISQVRVELLKWSFLCWVGQVAAMAGLLAFMLRT